MSGKSDMRVFVIVSNPQDNVERVVAGLSLLERNIRFARAAGAASILTNVVAEPIRNHSVVVLYATHVVDRRLAGMLAKQPTANGALEWAAPNGALDVFSLSADVAARIDWTLASQNVDALRTQLNSLQITVERSGPEEDFLHFDVRDDASAKKAEDALWLSCRKPIDGLVSRNFNRYVSLFISRRIASTGITPNHISIFCLFLGVAAAVIAIGGTYWHLLAAATIFKINSILDGVDGELARVKFAHSKLGELLDSAGDNVANFSFFGALTYVCWRDGPTALAICGSVGLFFWSLYLVFLYSRLYTLKRGDVLLVKTNLDSTSIPIVARVVSFFRLILRRDTFVMIAFLLAIAGFAKFMLITILFGGTMTFGSACAHYLISFTRRDPQAAS